MITLSRQADKVFEGRSKGVVSERESKKWLYESCGDTEFKRLVRRGIREWRNHLWKLPEFVVSCFNDFSTAFFDGELELFEIIQLTNEVGKILNAQKSFNGTQREAQKKVADLGLLYFDLAIKIISVFEQDMHRKLSKKMKSTDANSHVPADFSYYKQFEMMAYLLGYAGTRFVSYDNSTYSKKTNKWCQICFRRAPPGSNHCLLHDTTNEFKTNHRFGKKVYVAMVEHNPSLVVEWKQHRRSIREKEGWVRELNDSFDLPDMDWKTALITWINRSPSLAKRLSVEVIQSIEYWIDAVKYLRAQFQNQLERSYHLHAVWSWLHMAENWSEIEDMFISQDYVKRRVSKSPVSSIPTEIQIARQCENEPGISKTEIARRLEMSPQNVGQLIKCNKELQKYFA